MRRKRTPNDDVGAFAQEWIWRFSKATGIPKYVFLFIGRFTRRTRAGEFETPPLPVNAFVNDTGMSPATVRRSIAELYRAGEIDIVKSTRRGTEHRYRLRRQLHLPMDAEPAIHRSERALSALTQSSDSDQADHSQRSDGALSALTLSGRDAGGVFSSSTKYQVLSTSTTEEQAAAEFVDWFLAEYRTRRGFPYRVKRASAEDVAVRLLRDRTLDRLQAMAVLMFTATRDAFILESDYSLFVLEHKASYLEGIAVANEQPQTAGPLTASTWAACAHEPRCIVASECHRRQLDALQQEAVG